MNLEIPQLSLVILIGATSAGKTTFAQRHFQPTEIVSSDALRRQVSDNENDQQASGDAFDLLHRIVAMRLKRGLLTVVDATNTRADERRPLLSIARDHYVQPVAVVFDLPEGLSQNRNKARPDRNVPPEVIHRHAMQVDRSLAKLRNEGFSRVYHFEHVDEINEAFIERVPLEVNCRERLGPFDIIGDVHGCTDELEDLLIMMGYTKEYIAPGNSAAIRSSAEYPYPYRYTHPDDRTAVFVGDLVDRGPRILHACLIASHMQAAGNALVVPGNHDDKFLRWLKNNPVEMAHGLQNTVAEFETQPEEIRRVLHGVLLRFFEALPSHLVLDGGRLVVAHAGVRQHMIGRDTKRVRDFALYGDTRGETDEAGRPIRYNWAANYHGDARIVYGHTPIETPQWENLAINIDTGCVYGGRLTALRYPELELVSTPARRVYYERKSLPTP